MLDKIQIGIDALSEKYKVPAAVIYILAAFALIVIIDKLTGG